MKSKKVNEFLKESNAIEGVYDNDSLKQAQYAWEYLETQEEITIGVVLKAHKILMLHQNLSSDEKGYFRKRQVWVGYREGLQYPFIKDAMEVWCMNAWLYPEKWKRHHVRYEKIHPFVDGNGRSGRLFLNWQRIKRRLPILVIKESEKNKYYKWFENKDPDS